MKEYICDLCRKKIAPYDIRMEVEVYVDGKKKTLDMHSVCYHHFIEAIKETIGEEEE